MLTGAGRAWSYHQRALLAETRYGSRDVRGALANETVLHVDPSKQDGPATNNEGKLYRWLQVRAV